jgi:hypothetical protein
VVGRQVGEETDEAIERGKTDETNNYVHKFYIHSCNNSLYIGLK